MQLYPVPPLVFPQRKKGNWFVRSNNKVSFILV